MKHETYKKLYLIRRVEEEIARIYPTDKIKSPCHLSIGQEAVSVAVCSALSQTDVVFGTYRGHALYLAKGGNLNKMIAELYGKKDGCAGGKGGSMHLVDVQAGMMGASAIVGSTIPESVGYAFAMKLRKSDRVVASFFGDGAVEEGAFHESLNFAALHQIPVVFVCENNGFAIHSRLDARQAGVGIAERARSYGIVAETVDSSNYEDLESHAFRAIVETRAGAGPRFLECLTYRRREHVGPNEDYNSGYRTADEAAEWVRRDAIATEGAKLPTAERLALEESVETEIAAAFAFAEESPWPSPSDLMTDLFREAAYESHSIVR